MTAWTLLSPAQKEAAVLPLAKRGFTASQIATELRAPSRNSAITIIARLQKQGKLPPPRKRAARPARQSPPKPGAFSISAWNARSGVHPNDFAGRAEQRAASPGFIVRAAAFEPLEGHEPITLMDLTNTTCRWPVGEDAPQFFCGAPCDFDQSYCTTHANLSRARQHGAEHVAEAIETA